jgi:hypothetical protein
MTVLSVRSLVMLLLKMKDREAMLIVSLVTTASSPTWRVSVVLATDHYGIL